MTNHDIIKIVNLAVNKDMNGNAFSPDEYKTMINAHSRRLFMECLGLTQEYQNGLPISRTAVSISKVNEMKLLPFHVVEVIAVTGGQLNVTGKDIAFLSAMLPSTLSGRGFDELFDYELPYRLTDPIVAPTLDDPIFVWRSPVEILVYPATVTSVIAYYYTYPDDANFTMTYDANLLPVYTSINELDWNDTEKTEIAYRMIREAGINIEKADAVGYADKVISTGR